MISQKIFDLCHSSNTISSKIAENPHLAPSHAAHTLYRRHGGTAHHTGSANGAAKDGYDLERAYNCGQWGNPLAGVTSPPLVGSSGVVPLTIIGPLPDICRHMSNCIARAEKEVFLATNYWKASDAATLITNGLKELSRRAGEKGTKAIVKIMYDRGSAKQVIENHQVVSVTEYTAKSVQLPPPQEIPNIDLQVINYHRPAFGTFHAKFMIVDRNIAILSSKNIQDNDNLEMMTHLEGSIVDSFYDMALISWWKELKPPLPCSTLPAPQANLSDGQQSVDQKTVNLPRPMKPNQYKTDPVGQQASQHRPGELDASVADLFQSLADQIKNPNPLDLPGHTEKDPHYDPDIAAEVQRSLHVLAPRASERKIDAITRHLNTTIQPDTKGTAPDVGLGDEMIPLIPHPLHDPVPMAMVCRKPWGGTREPIFDLLPTDKHTAANNSSLHVPQNEAFLSAIRNAETSVFIQTPNLNAEPLLPALLEAVRRGVNVTYYVTLGYNDAGELLPFQGGTNEMVAHKLYSALTPAEKENLNIYNYVGKDQTRPIHNKFKKRSCHIKVMIVDHHIGIQGNGNQDTQSWFHSQEVNVMIDSAAICAAWEEGLRRNQNTHLYGAVSKENGCWRDEKGELAEGTIGVDPGRFSWARGIVGAVQRLSLSPALVTAQERKD
ncbi:MAG: hypothetical protein LQ338_006063 [Usnochroma carphineum]|nr:MAG: hypothetical protein LQ338_006063 [Usnochroma carphineum]